jgi:taurine dioxygenase
LGNTVVPKKEIASDNKFGYVPGRTTVEDHSNYAHDDLLPSFPDIHWDALEYTPYEDRGLRGDPKFRDLLKDATAVFDYNPKIGTEIHGVDLANLTEAQKDDLARLIAYRGVVFFRAQKNFDIDAQRDLGRHFGKLHKVSFQEPSITSCKVNTDSVKHATTAVPKKKGLEDVHVVYSGDNAGDNRALFSPSFLWHSDVCLKLSIIDPTHQI